jgi:hypothetical protein
MSPRAIGPALTRGGNAPKTPVREEFLHRIMRMLFKWLSIKLCPQPIAISGKFRYTRDETELKIEVEAKMDGRRGTAKTKSRHGRRPA